MNSFLLKFLFLALVVTPCVGQNQLDSLRAVWNDDKKTDGIRVKALIEISDEYVKIDLDSSLFYAQKAYDIASQKNLNKFRGEAKVSVGNALYRKGAYESSRKTYNEAIAIARKEGDSLTVANSYYKIGTTHFPKGEYEKALDYFEKSVAIFKSLNNNNGLGEVYNNIGIIDIIQKKYDQAETDLKLSMQYYRKSENPDGISSPTKNLAILKKRQGDYSNAIELYMKSIAIDEKNGNEYFVANGYLNLANLYFDYDDLDTFFEYANKSLDIRRRLGDKRGIVKSLNNLGAGYSKINNHKKAMEVYDECLPIAEELAEYKTIAHILISKALIQTREGTPELAIDNINRAMSLSEKLGDKQGIARSDMAYGHYYKSIGNKQQAIKYYSQGLELAKGTDLQLTKDIAFELFQMYEVIGNSSLALDTHKLYLSTRDSIDAKANKREITRQEFKYEYEKKAYADSIAFESKQEIQKTKLEKTQNQRQSLLILFVLVAGFSILLWNRIKLVKRQKETIEEQNENLTNLTDNLQELNENLEQEVEERTEKIVEINKDLKKSDERYTYALEASNDGIWDYNVKKDKISFSPAIYTMLGYEPYEFPETREAIYNLLNSEEHKNNKRKAQDLFSNQNEQTYLLDEYRLVRKDGKIVWVQVKGKIVEKDENNNPLRVVGTHTDITADKLKNQEMLEAVLNTEDAERSRISKDIHDGLQQTLTISLLNFQSLKKDVKGLSSKAIEKFDLGWKYLQNAISESRNVAHTLMPKSIVDFGILSAFQDIIDGVNSAHEATTFHFHHNLTKERLDNKQIEITLYRILQEAINNINKYAKATNVYIQLKEYDDIIMLTIEDNGKGFDVKNMQKDATGLGLRSMQNRLDAINGYLEIDSAIGRGTTILVEINKNENLA